MSCDTEPMTVYLFGLIGYVKVTVLIEIKDGVRSNDSYRKR